MLRAAILIGVLLLAAFLGLLYVRARRRRNLVRACPWPKPEYWRGSSDGNG